MGDAARGVRRCARHAYGSRRTGRRVGSAAGAQAGLLARGRAGVGSAARRRAAVGGEEDGARRGGKRAVTNARFVVRVGPAGGAPIPTFIRTLVVVVRRARRPCTVRGRALCAVYSTAQPALPPALRCPPHAARARDTGVCGPLPSAPLFVRRRALSRGVHWPCRARAPRSAPVRARCARTHLQRGAMHREGVPSGGGGAAHARARTATAHRAPGACAGLRVRSADRALAVLCSLASRVQPSSLVATPLRERADHSRGAFAARVRR